MKKTLVLLLCLFVFGCGQKATTSQENKELSEKETIQRMQNMWKEDIDLLAIKYGMDSDKMLNIISDYEALTFGHSITRMLYNFNYKSDNFARKSSSPQKETRPKPEIVDITTAIDRISIKYQISKEIIVNIILDLKSIEHSGTD
ncbi:MAG: hypothetical protein FJZ16_00885 [Candidatus Omnitrophica bacterium]|nr:hypothetical protein [Candidatus Omnitrophota bacterium]